MQGRDTGHFGSGVYFSSYRFEKNHDYANDTENLTNNNPNFIKIKDNIYRVDFDLYKNMYKVDSKIEGDILFTLLKNVNSFYYNVIYKDFNNLAQLYQEIMHNAKALGLKTFSYKELINMAINHEKSDNIQSFSTLFMEKNGYNGVNVSGIPFYDTTTHGSVIYDLSKLSNIEKIKSNTNYNVWNGLYLHDTYNQTLAKNDLFDNKVNFIKGNVKNIDNELLDTLTKNQLIRLIKNSIQNKIFLTDYELLYKIKNLDVIKIYLKLFYNYLSKNKINDEYIIKDLLRSIIQTKSFYYGDILLNNNSYFLFDILQKLPYYLEDNEKQELINQIKLQIKHNLTKIEIEEINDYLS